MEKEKSYKIITGEAASASTASLDLESKVNSLLDEVSKSGKTASVNGAPFVLSSNAKSVIIAQCILIN